jgi:D-alanine-D-alanine ligase
MEEKLIIIFGGESSERLVSTASAQALARILNSARLWFWHPFGSIYDVSHDSLLAHKDSFKNEFKPEGKARFDDLNLAVQSLGKAGQTFVLATHGGKGENGFIQSILESHGHPFTGSDAKSSQLAFDKVATKRHLLGTKMKMAPELVIETHETDSWTKLEDFLKVHSEIVVKPICGGSSIGCHFIRSDQQLSALFGVLKDAQTKLMAEKLLKGRELTVGVIESSQGLMALPVTEIALSQNQDFNYDGKYLGVGTKEITPALISESIARETQEIALSAHKACGLSGYSRSDIILTEEGLYFLEINTLPGLTEQSLVPQQLAAAKISMRDFLSQQILLANAKCH